GGLDQQSYLVSADFSRQPIAAENKRIPNTELQRVDFDVDTSVSAQRLQDHVAIAVCLSLFLSDLARINELLNQRLVLCDTYDLALTEEVGPAVANLAEKHPVAVYRGCGECRSETFVLGIGSAFSVD